MSAAPTSEEGGRRRTRLAVLWTVAGIAAAAMIVIAFLSPPLAAAGWLIAFILLSAIPLGSLYLLMIHGLTGGRWGVSLGALWQPAALTIPLMGLLFVPVLVGIPALYSWSGGGGHVPSSVAAYYLNWPLYVVRAAIAFVGWSVLAVMFPRLAGRSGTFFSAVGLVFSAVMMTVLPVDWILSTEPVFISTSFGASIVIMQLFAALAYAALFAPASLEPTARRDLGALMLTAVLGLTYLDFMAVLVLWYGDLPDKIGWLLTRTHDPWAEIMMAAFTLGAVLPLIILLSPRGRASASALRFAGISIFIGLGLYSVWLLAPDYGPWTFGTAALSVLALACGFAAAISARLPATFFTRSRTAAHD